MIATIEMVFVLKFRNLTRASEVCAARNASSAPHSAAARASALVLSLPPAETEASSREETVAEADAVAEAEAEAVAGVVVASCSTDVANPSSEAAVAAWTDAGSSAYMY